MDKIIINGARENNLKNVSLELPKNKLIVMTGVSGSGKSSLAFDTIYAEGERRYIESLNAYARQFLGGSNKPDVDSIEGLSPSISIDQKSTNNNPRSTVGTITEIYDYLRLLYARIGVPICPNHKIPISSQSIEEMTDQVLKLELNNIELKQENNEFFITVEAGYPLTKLSKFALDNELEGLEFACGIPGTIGGAIRMNAGAYGGEMKDIVISTRYMDLKGNIKELNLEQHEFSYRNSVFSKNDFIILSTTIKLKKRVL